MKNHATRRLLIFLMMSILFCLALGGAAAEECGDDNHDIGHIVLDNGSGLLQYCRNDCGHEALLYLHPYEFTIGQSTFDVSVTSSGSEFLGPPYNAPVVTQSRPGPNSNLQSMSIDLRNVTVPGQYYYAIKIEKYVLSGLINLITPDHKHSISYSASGDTITAFCTNGCARAGTLTLSPDLESETLVSVTTSGLWPTDAQVSPVSYVDANGNPVSGIPHQQGDYTASITVGGATASVSFTITDTIITPTLLPADRIVPNAPVGMAFASQTIEDGQYHMVISRENTDWSAMVAQLFDTQRQMMIWQTPHIVPYPGATRYAYISTSSSSVDAAVEDLRNQSSNVHISMIGGNATLAMRNLGSYTPENGLFIPSNSSETSTFVLAGYGRGLYGSGVRSG